MVLRGNFCRCVRHLSVVHVLDEVVNMFEVFFDCQLLFNWIIHLFIAGLKVRGRNLSIAVE